MTYSQQVKTELCETKSNCKECQKAMLYGMLLMCKGVTESGISMYTESRAVADFFAHGLVELTGCIVTVHQPDLRQRSKKPIYTIMVENEQDIQNILVLFFPNGIVDKRQISEEYLQKECCVISLLRGVYCVCGMMSDPKKEYHLEFNFSNEIICKEFINLLRAFELDYKMTTRNKNYIAYVKESQQIEDTLTCLGAVKCSMELMNLKIEKELRNAANRRTNCETANIDKTINAALSQIAKIEKIKAVKGLSWLTPELKEVAQLRLNNPEMSLSELCEISPFTISRSGLNHRLKKLCNIADTLG